MPVSRHSIIIFKETVCPNSRRYSMTSYVYLFISTTIFSLILPTQAHPQGKQFWTTVGDDELVSALKLKWNEETAKNIIIFVADGMGVNTVTASRIYRAGEESLLAFETFPHVGIIKTYGTNKQVPDSACTATALFCGVKSNYETLGVTADVEHGNCDASLKEENRLDSMMVWAQMDGKSTGIVTNTRVTHATPASTYARSADRHWECNSQVPANASCKDIGRQLVEDSPGKNFNVILGGGRQCLGNNISITEKDPIENGTGLRTDGIDLIDQWVQQKKQSGLNYFVAEDTSQLRDLHFNTTDYLLGVFSNSHMPYEYKRDKSDSGIPSLSLMATTAVNILKKNKQGFVLMVEGGMIDQAHHLGAARVALEEVVQLNNAVNDVIKLLEEDGILDETLIILTSDHAHTLSINGYPKKGNNILGVATESKVDGIPWTTLTYGVGTQANYQYSAINGTVKRQDPREMDTTSYDFRQLAAAPHDLSAHGGGDVVAYARGPMAHLIHSVHEQSYIAYVMAYAAKIGPYAHLRSPNTGCNIKPNTLVNFMIPILVVISYTVRYYYASIY